MKLTIFSAILMFVCTGSTASSPPGALENAPLTAADTAGVPTLAGSATRLTDAANTYLSGIDENQSKLAACETAHAAGADAAASATYLDCSLSVLEVETVAAAAFRQAVERFGADVGGLIAHVNQARARVSAQQVQRQKDEVQSRNALVAVGNRVSALRAKQASTGLNADDRKEVARLMIDDGFSRGRIERHQRAQQQQLAAIAKLDKVANFYAELVDAAELNAYALKGREEALADVRRDVGEGAEAQGLLFEYRGVAESGAALTAALQQANSAGIEPARFYTGDEVDDEPMPAMASSLPNDDAITAFLNSWLPLSAEGEAK
jgi:hypothetical protein